MLVRQNLLSEGTRQNIDAIRLGIEGRPAITFGAFLGYAVSPLPSNYLFIAYGLTSLPIAYLALPFFVGRTLSYGFWLETASTVGDKLDLDWFESSPYLVGYFLFSQLALLPVILLLHTYRLGGRTRGEAAQVAWKAKLIVSAPLVFLAANFTVTIRPWSKRVCCPHSLSVT
jgi:hypothetical protein